MKTTFVKLGGSLITDKSTEASFRVKVMARLAAEIHAAHVRRPEQRLLLAHGSGSFGHFVAQRHQTMSGVYDEKSWRGFAEVANVAALLNHLVTDQLRLAGLPVWRLQPSASARCRAGDLVRLDDHPIREALERGIIPLVYGDVALDDERGGTIISTEQIFMYLAHHLPVQRIVLVGEFPGVLDSNENVIPVITPELLPGYADALGGSHGTDVTGGMSTKVRDMLMLAQQVQGLEIRIIDGRQAGLLRDVLTEENMSAGTLIHA